MRLPFAQEVPTRIVEVFVLGEVYLLAVGVGVAGNLFEFTFAGVGVGDAAQSIGRPVVGLARVGRCVPCGVVDRGFYSTSEFVIAVCEDLSLGINTRSNRSVRVVRKSQCVVGIGLARDGIGEYPDMLVMSNRQSALCLSCHRL